MVSKIILIGNVSDLDVISNKLLQDTDTKNFSFSLETHNELQYRKIKHESADNLLTEDERFRIFDKMHKFRTWYSTIPSQNYELDGVNILQIFDAQEFQSYIMPNLINLITIVKIIELEKPKKIIVTNSLSKLTKTAIKDQNIEINIFQNKIITNLFWDKITIKYNIGKIPITFNLSQNNYVKIKNFIESFAGLIYGFWFDLKKSKKKCIVFLEFNPESFSKTLLAMKNYDGNIILVNRRRTPIWSKKSLGIIRKSKCKILKLDDILTIKEKKEISSLTKTYSQKIEKLWENSKFFNELFQIDGYSFWDSIKDGMIKMYSNKLTAHISLILSIKKFFENTDIRCLVSLNESGETEKSFLAYNKRKIPSILLEHGFIERTAKTKRFDILSDYGSFNDKIAVWGEMKKEWLMNQYDIKTERIIVTGSPRHDDYFFSRLEKINKKEKTLLLAPNPINDLNGLSSTDLKLRVNKVIAEVISSAKKIGDVRIIVKLHPIQLKHNEEMLSFIKNLDNSIPVYLWSSIIDTINKADAVLVISPEIHATPTMLLESMILGKPTMNVYISKSIPQYYHVQSEAVFTVTDSCNFEDNLKKILFDEKFQDTLKMNADNFVAKFLSFRGNASEKFASILQSY